MESLNATLTLLGLALLAASWVYLMIVAFKDDYAWGMTSVFLPPLAYLYAAFNPAKATGVLVLAVLGVVMLLLG